MLSLQRVIESIIIKIHRNKVLFPGKVLLLWWVLMRALCLSSMVVVSRGCKLLRFAMRLRLWALHLTLSWRETLLQTNPRRLQMWQAQIPGLFRLRCR